MDDGDGREIDPDVDLRVPAQRRQRAFDPAVLGVIAAGGVLGAEARYALERAVPSAAGDWPVATFVINVAGSLLIGVLMVVVTELRTPHRLVRPFLGVGILGGFTTFSTAVVEVVALQRAGEPVLGLAYLVGTALSALLAVALGVAATRRAAGRPVRPDAVA
ncbi:MAG TPA: CrcB family protein [Blastococcus sp.]